MHRVSVYQPLSLSMYKCLLLNNILIRECGVNILHNFTSTRKQSSENGKCTLVKRLTSEEMEDSNHALSITALPLSRGTVDFNKQ
jgi:hypothetical protein